MSGRDFQVVGTSPVRHDGVDKVTGRAIFGVDVALPGMLHGKVLRSPRAHARIRSIDTRRAAAADGVHAVVTAQDMPQRQPGDPPGVIGPARAKLMNVLAHDKVLYQGHAIAAIAASSPHLAERALQLIETEYEVLKPVVDVRAAMAPDAPLLHADLRTETVGEFADEPSNVAKHLIFEEGDVEQGFAAADLVIEREFSTSTVHQGYIEPQNALADWSPDGQLVIQCSTQGHFGVRAELSDLLDWPPSKIKVIPAEIGGGFGGKLTNYLAPLAALLSRKSGHPVKLTMDRAETLRGTGPAPGTFARVKMGATRDGRITAVEVFMAFEAGGFPGSSVGGGCNTALGPYSVENFRIDGYDVVVNKPKSQAFRAPGAPQAEFAVESVVDELSGRLGIDPIEFRRRNAAKEGDRRSNGTVHGVIGHAETLEAARRSDHYRTDLEEVPGLKRGRGVAAAFWTNGGGTSSVRCRLNSDGSVTMHESSPDIGGTRTSIAMQLSETLGIPVEDVKPVVADTDSIAVGGNAAGSRTTFATGWAAIEAARDLRERMIEGLADAWDVPVDAISLADGGFRRDGTAVSFKEAAAILDDEGLQLVGRATASPSGVGTTFAAHIVDVEVDEETGKVKVIRYTAAQDVGTAVYPPYVEGQIEGGVAQGIGWALSEEYVYDSDGQLRNASLLDYRMPTSLDVPEIETILVEVPNPGHPYGVRGVGEIPVVPPLAAIANAIHAAVGVRIRDLPASPSRVYAAIRARGAEAAIPPGAAPPVAR